MTVDAIMCFITTGGTNQPIDEKNQACNYQYPENHHKNHICISHSPITHHAGPHAPTVISSCLSQSRALWTMNSSIDKSKQRAKELIFLLYYTQWSVIIGHI